MNPTYQAKHLATTGVVTPRQQGQEYAARAAANGRVLMPARGRRAAYIAWNPRRGATAAPSKAVA